jgi:hypothetical protein
MGAKLDHNDLLKLEEGFKSGAEAEELKIAEAVLKRLGYEKISARPPAKRKTGPKPGTNPTEDEIRIRIEFLRLVLGDDAKDLSVVHLLSSLLELLKTYNAHCSTGLYLTQAERRVEIHQLKEDCTEADLTHLASAAEASVLTPWQDMVETAIAVPGLNRGEMQIYSAIRVPLALALDELPAGDLKVQIEKSPQKSPRKPEDVVETDPQILLLESQKWSNGLYASTSRNETLRAAIARLFEMRAVLDTCRLVNVDSEIQQLYEFVRSVSHASDPGDISEVLGKLDALFLGAAKRQGVSPFSQLFNEEMKFGPSRIPEDGQIIASPLTVARARPTRVKRPEKKRVRRK